MIRYPSARDIEVKSVGLEEAFLELTASDQSEPFDTDIVPGDNAI